METKAEYVIAASPYLSKEAIVEASAELPYRRPGIYFLIDCGEIVYVGQSSFMVLSRLVSHAQRRRFDRVTVLAYPANVDLDVIEAEYIWCLEPKYNAKIPPNPHYMRKEKLKETLHIGTRHLNRLIRESKARSRLGGYYDIRDLQEQQQ